MTAKRPQGEPSERPSSKLGAKLTATQRRPAELFATNGTLVVQSGKGGRYREVPLNVDAQGAIEDYLANGRKNDSPFLFKTQRSEQSTTRGIQNILEKYQKLTGLKDPAPTSSSTVTKPNGVESATSEITVNIKATIKVNSSKTAVYYYGHTYASAPVTSEMQMNQYYRSPFICTWTLEQSNPSTTGYGTAIATPIYINTGVSWGYYKCKNTYNVTAPGFTPYTGSLDSAQLYVEF